ncbi:DinB family protein [Mucilaginibacter sp. dw_454]|uniref:DinB family protein n=1 Tax=Mucilaginibacter sp. dw_454 TaxID=2720079 RepID=UPI001BD3ACEB|nr:DinB family protein [Mucilaginibacter sp. dw_454]
MHKPERTAYESFYSTYIKLVDQENILEKLEGLKTSTYQLFNSLTDEQANHAYGPGKWTIKQVVGHLIDAERTFAYRILAFSRGQQELPGFDENVYVELSNANDRSIQDLSAEFKTVREANLYMIRALTPEQIENKGIANGSPIQVNTIVYILAGHEVHHLNILKERYGV